MFVGIYRNGKKAKTVYPSFDFGGSQNAPENKKYTSIALFTSQ
jgi:hypothetical protein